MNSTSEGRPRRVPLFFAILSFVLGLMSLSIGLSRPSIANMRTIDLVHLLGTGGCFGAGVVAVALNLLGRRTG